MDEVDDRLLSLFIGSKEDCKTNSKEINVKHPAVITMISMIIFVAVCTLQDVEELHME